MKMTLKATMRSTCSSALLLFLVTAWQSPCPATAAEQQPSAQPSKTTAAAKTPAAISKQSGTTITAKPVATSAQKPAAAAPTSASAATASQKPTATAPASSPAKPPVPQGKPAVSADKSTNQEKQPSTPPPGKQTAGDKEKLSGSWYVSVAKDGANVRSGPDSKETVLWEVFQYYPLKILKRQGEWIHAEDFEGDKGWIPASLVSTKKTLIVKVKNGNMRSAPSTNSDVIANVKYGVVFFVEKSEGDWVQVRHSDNTSGWINRTLIWPDDI